MKLPELESPERYAGLYVFDFGDQTAVGYTAEEIAVLLESERYKDGKVYRIHRALPDGTMELQGVPRERFLSEEGMFFYRRDLDSARNDFAELDDLARRVAPPCRMKLQLARLAPPGSDVAGQSQATGETYMTVLIYPAEYTHDVSKWLSDADFRGGDYVEGGISLVTNYYEMRATVLERRQLWPATGMSRPAEEVLATTHLAIQRRLAG
ncbi:MAG TPA: hypothetical protein PL151_19870 [Phycisphaerae bacterium]|nr:hypothetical protein [Phycisphaerae bacterium]